MRFKLFKLSADRGTKTMDCFESGFLWIKTLNWLVLNTLVFLQRSQTEGRAAMMESSDDCHFIQCPEIDSRCSWSVYMEDTNFQQNSGFNITIAKLAEVVDNESNLPRRSYLLERCLVGLSHSRYTDHCLLLWTISPKNPFNLLTRGMKITSWT